MRVIFISDLHLSPLTKVENQLFIKLMQEWVLKYDALYILGDFFDYWVGDDDDNEFISSIKNTLLAFTYHKPIYFIAGNHDFAIGKVFVKDTGIKIIKDLSTLHTGQKRILLSHGDVFCTLDKPYQRMKMILQNKFIIFLLRKLPIKFRYWLKDKLQKTNKDNYNKLDKSVYQVVDKTIIKYCIQTNCNIVIHGHTHNPGKYLIKTSDIRIERLEIPNWCGNKIGGYVELVDDVLQIIN